MSQAKEDSLHQYGRLYLHIRVQIKFCSNGKRAQRNDQYINHFLCLNCVSKQTELGATVCWLAYSWLIVDQVVHCSNPLWNPICTVVYMIINTSPLDRCDVYCHLSSFLKCMNYSTLSREMYVYVTDSGLVICVNNN